MNNKKRVSCLEFTDPSISIPWQLNEDDFLRLLKFERNESHIYNFKAKLAPLNMSVNNMFTFNEKGYEFKVIIYQSVVEKRHNSKKNYIHHDNTNYLKDYLQDKFGPPKVISKLVSIVNKPFYTYRWTFENLKFTHKYQDSVGGFYESLLIGVQY